MLLVLLALTLVLVFAGRKLLAAADSAMLTGASGRRASFGLGLTVSAVVAGSLFVHVPAPVTTAYATRGAETFAVVPKGQPAGALAARPVRLERSGPVLRSTVAGGRTCGRPRRERIPAMAGAPVTVASTPPSPSPSSPCASSPERPAATASP